MCALNFRKWCIDWCLPDCSCTPGTCGFAEDRNGRIGCWLGGLGVVVVDVNAVVADEVAVGCAGAPALAAGPLVVVEGGGFGFADTSYRCLCSAA
uniref:Secreted protein n=1 Tax=Romanomermis culicivorax TaxID=13658 RepID=A0A915HV69_ROMCU